MMQCLCSLLYVPSNDTLLGYCIYYSIINTSGASQINVWTTVSKTMACSQSHGSSHIENNYVETLQLVWSAATQDL